MNNNYFGSTFEEDDLGSGNLNDNVRRCKEIISEGLIFNYRNLIEETIENCLDHFRYSDALLFVNALLRISPFDSDLWYTKAVCLTSLGKKKKAGYSIERAYALNPTDVDILLEKAFILIKQRKFNEAEKCLKKAKNFDSENPVLYLHLGNLYTERKEFYNAIACYEKSIELSPESPDGYFKMAVCYEIMENPEKALEFYEKYLDADPECEIGWYNRGIILEKLHHYEKAVNSYELSLALYPYFADGWYNLGNLLSDLGRHAEAIETLEKFISLDPEDETAHYNLASLYDLMGNHEMALIHYTKAIRLNRNYCQAYLGRGGVHLKTGNKKEALKNFRFAMFTDDLRQPNEKYKYSVRLSRGEDLEKLSRMTKFGSEKIRNKDLFMKVQFLIKSGKYSEAVPFVFFLMKSHEYYAHSLFFLSWIYFKLKDDKKGTAYLRLFLLSDDDAEYHFCKEFPVAGTSKLFNQIFYSV